MTIGQGPGKRAYQLLLCNRSSQASDFTQQRFTASKVWGCRQPGSAASLGLLSCIWGQQVSWLGACCSRVVSTGMAQAPFVLSPSRRPALAHLPAAATGQENRQKPTPPSGLRPELAWCHICHLFSFSFETQSEHEQGRGRGRSPSRLLAQRRAPARGSIPQP